MELSVTRAGHLSIESVVCGPIETNTYFAISGSEAVVIDPAWDGERLVEYFQGEHPDVRIVATACTHGHADHIGGVAGMRRALGEQVPFILPRDDEGIVAGSIAHQRAGWGIDTEDPGAPDRTVTEGDAIAFGDTCLQVVSVPGHTPGGVVLFCSSEKGNVAFVGDTLFPGSHGRTDLDGGDEVQIMRSLAKMARLLPADTLCLPGHGGTTTIARELTTNPYMRHAHDAGL